MNSSTSRLTRSRTSPATFLPSITFSVVAITWTLEPIRKASSPRTQGADRAAAHPRPRTPECDALQGRPSWSQSPLLLDRGVIHHEFAFAAVAGEAHHHEAARLHADDHAVAQGRVLDVVADAERGAGLCG